MSPPTNHIGGGLNLADICLGAGQNAKSGGRCVEREPQAAQAAWGVFVVGTPIVVGLQRETKRKATFLCGGCLKKTHPFVAQDPRILKAQRQTSLFAKATLAAKLPSGMGSSRAALLLAQCSSFAIRNLHKIIGCQIREPSRLASNKTCPNYSK